MHRISKEKGGWNESGKIEILEEYIQKQRFVAIRIVLPPIIKKLAPTTAEKFGTNKAKKKV